MNTTSNSEKTVILLGTSNNQGNTAALAKIISEQTNATIYNLKGYKVLPFDYEFKNGNDDFIPLIQELTNYDHIVFATPVYWYTMCAQMKIFFDRLSDLLHIHKDLGRQLRKVSSAVLSTGASPQVKSSFEEVFINSFNYLDINYKGMPYCFCEDFFVYDNHKDYIHSQLKVIMDS